MPKSATSRAWKWSAPSPKICTGTFCRWALISSRLQRKAYHTFDGDGMIRHRVDQGTTRYRNRFIENEGFVRARAGIGSTSMNSLMDPTPSRVAPRPESRQHRLAFHNDTLYAYASRRNRQSSLYRALRRSVPRLRRQTHTPVYSTPQDRQEDGRDDGLWLLFSGPLRELLRHQ